MNFEKKNTFYRSATYAFGRFLNLDKVYLCSVYRSMDYNDHYHTHAHTVVFRKIMTNYFFHLYL